MPRLLGAIATSFRKRETASGRSPFCSATTAALLSAPRSSGNAARYAAYPTSASPSRPAFCSSKARASCCRDVIPMEGEARLSNSVLGEVDPGIVRKPLAQPALLFGGKRQRSLPDTAVSESPVFAREDARIDPCGVAQSQEVQHAAHR